MSPGFVYRKLSKFGNDENYVVVWKSTEVFPGCLECLYYSQLKSPAMTGYVKHTKIVSPSSVTINAFITRKKFYRTFPLRPQCTLRLKSKRIFLLFIYWQALILYKYKHMCFSNIISREVVGKVNSIIIFFNLLCHTNSTNKCRVPEQIYEIKK